MHLAIFTWRDGVTPAQIEPFTAALTHMPERVPQLSRYSFGADLGLRDGNADYGVCALVADADSLNAYLSDPEHQRAVRELALPFAEQRTAVQIHVADPGHTL